MMLLAIGPVGVRYLWRLEDGKLLETEKFDPEMRMSYWAPRKNIGAICHTTMVEIINEKGNFITSFDEPYPPSVTWSESGHRLAWAKRCQFDLRWAEHTSSGFNLFTIIGEQNYFPHSPSLSPNGNLLAYIRSRRPAPEPEMGLTCNAVITESIEKSWTEITKEGVCVLDLNTDTHRIILSDHDKFLIRAWFLSNSILMVTDDRGGLIFFDLSINQIISRCWANDPIVGLYKEPELLHLCDNAWGTATGPVIYDYKLYFQGKQILWD